MSQLNKEQKACVSKLTEFLNSPSRFICISGFAGTGKTYTIQHFLKSLDPAAWTCAASAPTNKAVSVLSSFGSAVGLNIPTLTTYSMLGLVLDNSNRVRTCKVSNDGKLHNFKLIVVDECSMSGQALSQRLYDKVEPWQKVIFMGDALQLNPVNEPVSPTFSMGELIHLTQVMRTEKGPILELIVQVREQADGNTAPIIAESGQDDNGDGLHVLTESDMTDLAVSQFQLDTLEVDIQDNRYLAWTNKAVKAFNKKVRKHLYGAIAEDYIVGETLALLDPVFEDEEPVFFTDDEATIMRADVVTFTDTNDIKARQYTVWRLHLANSKHSAIVTVLHKKSNGQYQQRLKELSDAANDKTMSWQVFWGFKEMFTEVRHVYGMTVHRSQGQSIPNVFLDCNNLFKNQRDLAELKRLLYVGTSRASKNLVINRKVLTVIE